MIILGIIIYDASRGTRMWVLKQAAVCCRFLGAVFSLSATELSIIKHKDASNEDMVSDAAIERNQHPLGHIDFPDYSQECHLF